MIKRYDAYLKSVTAKNSNVGLYIKQAVARQLADLEREKTKEFPYYFDKQEAARWLGFISILRHTSGEWKGQFFQIQDFQAFRWAVLFGWQRKDGKGRRFRRAYIEVARKQGKTEEAAAIAIGGLLIDGEETAQIFSAATTRQQAKIVYGAAKIMARELKKDSPAIEGMVRLLAHRILNTATDSFFEALSSDAWTLDGLSPHFSIIDEYHAHPTSDVLKVLETGAGARRSPLFYIITTAGFDIESPCFNLRRSAIDILSGSKQDETFFTAIYTLDEGDDWNNEKTWIKSNPQIGITPTWDFMRSEYVKAVNEGGQSEVEFKTKNLNIWTTSAKTWIADEAWMSCPNEIDVDQLYGRKCYGGLDFAAVSDFTAASLVFPPDDTENGEFIILPFFWIPEETLKIRSRDYPDMKRWVKDGFINVTPGNVTDYDYLIAEMHKIRETYTMLSMGYDPHNAWQTVAKLQDDGFPMAVYRQGYATMSPPTKEFERFVKQKRINHGNNPVLRWMMTNVNPKYDRAENITLHKMTKHQKIDGVIATVIAFGEMLSNPTADSYSSADAFMI
jgi:phage terminase large subunit-like protein